MSAGGSDDAPAPLTSSVLGIAIIAITGMQLMSTLDGTIVIVALPRMQAELDLSDAGKSWVITAYVLAFGGLLLLGGRIGDAIGHKRAFLSGVGTFTIASLVCGLATDEITLIVARAVQGIGAAVAAPTGLALIAMTYSVGHARNRALAVSAAMQATGSVLGLVLGGALTVVSWRLAFLINVPIGIVDHRHRGDPAGRDAPRAAQARRHRGTAGHPGLYLGGAAVHAGSGAGLGGPVRDRRGHRLGAVLRRLPGRRAHRGPSASSRCRCSTTATGWRRSSRVLRRRGDAERDGDDRPVRPGRHGLLRAQGRRLLHPVRGGARRGQRSSRRGSPRTSRRGG